MSRRSRPASWVCLSLEKRRYWTSRRMISLQPKNWAKTYRVLSIAELRLPAGSSLMYLSTNLSSRMLSSLACSAEAPKTVTTVLMTEPASAISAITMAVFMSPTVSCAVSRQALLARSAAMLGIQGVDPALAVADVEDAADLPGGGADLPPDPAPPGDSVAGGVDGVDVAGLVAYVNKSAVPGRD